LLTDGEPCADTPDDIIGMRPIVRLERFDPAQRFAAHLPVRVPEGGDRVAANLLIQRKLEQNVDLLLCAGKSWYWHG
jgi:hypothetical protein